jgi:hypothetical protein
MAGILSPLSPQFTRQAITPVAGYTLINGTANVLTWNVPNDGQLHFFTIAATIDVTVTEVGGIIGVAFTMPDNVGGFTYHLSAGNQGTGYDYSLFAPPPVMVKGGTAVSISQVSALTSGAATLWAAILGS